VMERLYSFPQNVISSICDPWQYLIFIKDPPNLVVEERRASVANQTLRGFRNSKRGFYPMSFQLEKIHQTESPRQFLMVSHPGVGLETA